jgi:REP-associated tyrosine transposase
MPRNPCAGTAGHLFHVTNHAIEGHLLCRDFGEFLALERLLARALQTIPIRLLAFCLMSNHWHLLLWPETDDDTKNFVRWLSMTHARNLRAWRGSSGGGAVYKGRYDASPVEAPAYFYTVVRYIERNPVRAGIVDRADEWLWSSASPTHALHGIQLAEWPLPMPADWNGFMNDVEPLADLEFVRERTRRGEAIARPRIVQPSLAVGGTTDARARSDVEPRMSSTAEAEFATLSRRHSRRPTI